MLTINITNLRKNIFELLGNTIKFNEPISVNTKEGNAIIMSEEDYNGLMETLYLKSIPSMEEKILEGMNTPVDECIPETEVVW